MEHSPPFYADRRGRPDPVCQPSFRAGVCAGGASVRVNLGDAVPNGVAQMRRYDVELLRTGEPQQYVLNFADRAGEQRHWLVLKFLVRGDTNSQLIGIKAIDITEQQRAAEPVRQSEERFRQLFEQAAVAMHEIDAEGIVRRVNRAECELLGLEPEEILGPARLGVHDAGGTR